MHKFEFARDPVWREVEYLERRQKYHELMRRAAAVTMQGAASLVLDLMLAVPADADPEIEGLLNFMSIAERLERTAEFWGSSKPIFEIDLTECKRSIGQVRHLIEFQKKDNESDGATCGAEDYRRTMAWKLDSMIDISRLPLNRPSNFIRSGHEAMRP